MSKESLQEIVARSNSLTELLLSQGGELTTEIEAELTSVAMSLVTKVDACGIVLERLDAEHDLWAARAAQYTKIARSMAAATSRIKDTLKGAMIAFETDTLQGEETRFSLINGRPKLVIDEANLDPSFKIQKVEMVIDKERLDNQVRSGFVVAGAHLEPVFQLRKYAANKGSKK